MKNHIHHFILDHRIGGPHRYVETIRDFGNNYGYNTIVITTNRGPITDVQLLNLRHKSFFLYPIEVICNIVTILQYLKQSTSDGSHLIAVHGVANIAPIIASRIAGIGIVWHIHETSANLKFFYCLGWLFIHKKNSIIGVVAKKSADVYGISKYTYLPPSVCENFWKRKTQTKELHVRNESKEKFRFLIVGNISPVKGIDIALAALSNLGVPFSLEIIGSNLATHQEYYRLLVSMAKNLQDKSPMSEINFLGWADSLNVREAMERCDIFLLPSRSEAAPIVLLEAMSMKCAIVASNVGDIPFILEDYQRGELFEVCNSEQLAFKIKKIIQNSLKTSPQDEPKFLGNISDIYQAYKKVMDKK